VGNAIWQQVSKHHYLAKLYLDWGYLLPSFRDDEPIVFYQTGEVVSSGIVALLQALTLGGPIYPYQP
jgi:hypothetical protein